MQKHAIIVGAGIAGLWCARELAALGLETVLVERAPFPGGHVARFCCKATDRCQRCGACILEDVSERVVASSNVTSLLRTTVERVERNDGSFLVEVLQRPVRIIPEQCNLCGACEQACPEPGALVRSPVDHALVLNEDRCRFFRDASCRACLDVCPENAFRLEDVPWTMDVKADSVILATGFRPFDPTEKPRFGYGRVPGVITALELENMLRADNWTSGTGDKQIRSVAFIQCVGSRDPSIGRDYCSRVCCGYGLRLARLLRSRFPSIDLSMFYMDIQTYDRDFEQRLSLAEKEVRLIRSIPGEIRTSQDGRAEVIYHGPDERRVAESFDLVVLSIGISPNPIQGFLEVESNVDGFAGPDGESVETGVDGLFVAGTAQGPRSIEDTITHAIKAAGAAASYVERSSRGGDK